MTANTSPRMGLMLPSNSDPFTPDDFVATMTTLDGIPGITPVANYNALPSGLTAAQHGSCYLQMDNQALWMWYKPTSGSQGKFVRVNSLGVLGTDTFTTTIASSANTDSLAPTLMSVTVTSPGGNRNLLVMAHIPAVDNTSSLNVTGVELFYNGTFKAWIDTTDGNYYNGVVLWYTMAMPPQGTAMTWALKMRTVNQTGGLGTSTAVAPGHMMVAEL